MPALNSGRRTFICIAAAATSALVFTGGTASAAGNTMSLKGPTSNTIGEPFSYKLSGHAAGKGDYIVAWEQFHKHGGCASTYAAESTRTFQTRYALSVAKNKKVKGGYAFRLRFSAVNAGTHGLCAYLINESSGKTYAHADAWWNNHS